MKKTVTKASPSPRLTSWEKHSRAVAYQAALESIVLLENDGVLPIVPGKVALFGSGAEMTIKGGTGSGEVNERAAISIREGLEKAGFTITTRRWLKEYMGICRDAEEAYKKAFQKRLRQLDVTELINIMQSPFCAPEGQPIDPEDLVGTDTCIYVVARQAGEGSDRRLDRDYMLSTREKEQIALCARHFKRCILVLNVGGPMDMGFLEEISGINAVVFYAQQGGMGGAAFADLICGRSNPSGRLADTWPQRYEDIPFSGEYSYLNDDLTEEYYREGIFVGYRYFDTFGVKPRYPFGYGLSYTQFALRFLSVTEHNGQVQVKVQVENIGVRPGKEVLQLYARCPGQLPKERQRLVSFGKTRLLLPGEQTELTLTLTARELASYREEDHCFVLEAGDYVLCLGANALDTVPVCEARVEQEQILSRHKSLCAPKEKPESLLVPLSLEEDLQLPAVVLQPTGTQEFVYELPTPQSLVPKLTALQQAQLCVGGGLFRFRQTDAPGAAGVTTDRLLRLGIPQRVLADGPAGVRLSKKSVRMKNGTVKPVMPAMAAIAYLPDFLKNFLCADERQGQLLYQFTTSFPVELALAQTWNTALLEQVGGAVGKEMEAYGVSYWLAPALNIHRNPLCGRNFEYFSEDPLVSGKMAAALTRGVQSVPGRFVTLKHFACNNQEDNRNRTNANVSQRALREIYLRGFEIAIREGKPEAVMTSYNRLNGVYTANSHDLLTKLLRCEWGFTGMVMTDWMSTGAGLADVGGCIAAGNDLIMPGSDGDVVKILHALQTGRITDVQLHRAAANVLASLRKTGEG